jgi:hypothetical protein
MRASCGRNIYNVESEVLKLGNAGIIEERDLTARLLWLFGPRRYSIEDE